MAVVIITGNERPTINFAPATVAEEVVQNVRTIITTIKYQIPLDREFGIDGEALDRPMPQAQAQALITSEIIRQIRRYEPRAIIESITFTGELSGRLVPRVEVRINETE